MRRTRYKSFRTARGGRVALLLFGLVFAAGGAAFTYFMAVRPALHILAARDWVATPCVIESASVRSHSSDDGNTYSVEVVYHYTFEGTAYRGDRYGFSVASTSGYEGKARAVQSLPPGSTATCYVNPADPSQAVVERGWTSDLWFGFIPLLFLFIGLAIAGYAMLHGRRASAAVSEAAQHADWLPRVAHPLEAGRAVLRPQHSRRVKFLGVLLFAAVWNGVVSVFVVQAVKGHAAGDADWFLTLFMVPFVLVGLGALGAVGHQALALFNPRIEVTLDRFHASPGDTLDLAWRIDGSAGRLRAIRVELVGEESATYRRGTDTITDRHRFVEQTAYETPADARHVEVAGRCVVTIPPDAMHSFKAANNAITWRLRVRGEAPRWPDVSDEYPILVGARP